METTTLSPVLLMFVPGVVMSVIMAVQAPRLNRQWRERRDAKLLASADALRERAAQH